jgi:response regulator RpfG family c-di-GMP phosphodiesterase
VVDVWDALCIDRPCRPAWNRDKAEEYIRQQSGQHFDPQVVERFMGLIGRG